ncbi:MAG: hypothetical protein AAFU65_10410 [Pseudomonadota bacterium]
MIHDDFLLDVDAGPVVYGLGTTASAFGIGAARVMGRMDHASPLSAQALAAMVPAFGPRMLIPRALSSITDAPFTGDAIMLFNLTRTPMEGVRIVGSDAATPRFTAAVFWSLAIMGAALLLLVLITTRRKWGAAGGHAAALPVWQSSVWLALTIGGIGLVMAGRVSLGLISLLLAQLLPRPGRAQ